MRWLQVVYVVLSMGLGVVFPMMGGGDYKPTDFAFTVLVKTGGQKKAVCIGVIDSELTFITASKCLTRVDPDQKLGTNQFVASILNPAKDITIEKVEPGKVGDAPEEGLSPFPDYATVIARAVPPGLEVKATDEMGMLSGTEPTYTPWPEDESSFAANITGVRASGIVAGMDNKAAAMKVLSNEECDQKIFTDVPTDLTGFISAQHQNLTAERDYFCAVKGEDGGQFPPGYPCEGDMGAPFIVDGVVWGLLIGAWCADDKNHTALFRTAVRSWSVRRFDGSRTDRTPTTRPADISTTAINRDDSTKGGGDGGGGDGGGGGGGGGGSGGAATNQLLGPIYILTTVVLINIKKLQFTF